MFSETFPYHPDNHDSSKDKLSEKNVSELSAFLRTQALEVANVTDPAKRIEAAAILISETEGNYAVQELGFQLGSAEAESYLAAQTRGLRAVGKAFNQVSYEQDPEAWMKSIAKAQGDTTALGIREIKPFLADRLGGEQQLSDLLTALFRKGDQVTTMLLVETVFLEGKRLGLLSEREATDLGLALSGEMLHKADQLIRALVYVAHACWEMSQIELKVAANTYTYPADAEGKNAKKQKQDQERIGAVENNDVVWDTDFALLPEMMAGYDADPNLQQTRFDTRQKKVDTIVYDLNKALEELVGKENWERVKFAGAREQSIQDLVASGARSKASREKCLRFLNRFAATSLGTRYDDFTIESADEDFKEQGFLMELGSNIEEAVMVAVAFSARHKKPVRYDFNTDIFTVDVAKKQIEVEKSADEDPSKPSILYRMVNPTAKSLGYTLVSV